ncbi:MAG TPA: carboxypeptidase-like regulatory domain-containing protein [Terriglobales bacterium]|nr:carboxypeptidase-like regulatory domain-containing protein [Terriglobales bacterium]
MRKALFGALLFALTTAAGAQKCVVPDLAGFTQSPTEHAINVIDKPFVVRSISGVIEFANGPLEPLPNVLVEVRGPGTDKKIQRTTTNNKGRFKIAHLPTGTFTFKTTLNGYASSVGTIIVSNKAHNSSIRIEMSIGN